MKFMNCGAFSIKKSVSSLTLGAVWGVLALASPALAQQNIVSFTNISLATTLNNGSSYTLGYEFHVSSPITIIGLSVFTANPTTGLSANVPVGLWNASANLVVSTSVLAGTTAPLTTDGFFRWASTPSIVLQAGNYFVGAEIPGGPDDYTYNVAGLSSIPDVTYVQNQFNGGATLSFPGTTSPAFIQNGFFGGNVVVSTISPVPEPSTFALAGLSAFGGLLAARRRRN